jgi:hypothetical protein
MAEITAPFSSRRLFAIAAGMWRERNAFVRAGWPRTTLRLWMALVTIVNRSLVGAPGFAPTDSRC